MDEKEIEYGGYTIKVVPQERPGDVLVIFFRAFKGDEGHTAFIIWEKISGTSQSKANLTDPEAYALLEKEGIKLAKETIDNENFKQGQEITSWCGE
ncbi:hypothetical protein A2876_00210 [Candidatus Amesbacteria bacterium RIFCSPHIGHO2_01_FULL_48_32b]|uniref:Uncharacterized protein n=1 Tax=Candidatus Amesbacteria bacterium RIFCSPHIGHO2_01_FULL_48_32b TaxID=1797253 RepID=A0A1F4YFW1_9BACT|nr:MAG: hypothetical protein A2876_00210 [Candidatus Amesbacteria bacterium RIFCSPHIGHO2_01_FULL_48_32b]